jgi:carbon-monoxide dehydrogenase medium subunit
MKPAPFDYHVPASAKEAVELLAELGDSAKVIAGGQSLIPLLALRLAVFDHLIDIRAVPGVRGISGRGATVWVGAGTTQAAIGRSGLIAAKVPLLARATPLIGHFQIRNRGTIGGSLAHAEAAAEYPAVALTLDAVIETTSPRGERAIPASEFFTGIWTTALEPDELLTGVMFTALPPLAAGRSGPRSSPSSRGRNRSAPESEDRGAPLGSRVPGGRAGFAIEEFSRRPGDFAVAGAAIAIELDAGNGPDPRDARVSRCAIGLFGLGPTPLRAAAAEASIVGSMASDLTADARAREIGRAAMADLDSVPSDLHGPAAYRKRVGAALVATAWQRAIREALGEEPEAGSG